MPDKLLLGLCVAAGLSAAGDPGQWPQWRGPDNNGIARGEAPIAWSDSQNIKWKAAIPGRGHSSPVIWGDRIFLTTAVPIGAAPAAAPPAAAAPQRGRGGPGGDSGPQAEHRFELLCIDRKTGKILWQRSARTAAPHEGFHRMYGSFASNSPVTDGKRVYAFFGSRGVYSYDLDGKPLWEKDFDVKMRMKLGFGEGTAPVIDGDVLILNFDQETGSFLAVLDKATGREIWKVNREETTSWAMPLVISHAGKKQIVVSATTKVRSYDYQTGKLLWECKGLGANVIPAPVYQNGVVYVMSGYRDPNLLAIRLGREGDLTGTDSVIWTNTRGNSYTPSPVLFDNKLFLLTDNGTVSLLDAKTGTPYFLQQRLPKPYTFKSSPVLAGGRLYMAAEDGDVVVLKAGEKYEVLATNTLKDQFFIATPAIADGEIYLRGQNTLFAIAAP